MSLLLLTTVAVASFRGTPILPNVTGPGFVTHLPADYSLYPCVSCFSAVPKAGPGVCGGENGMPPNIVISWDSTPVDFGPMRDVSLSGQPAKEFDGAGEQGFDFTVDHHYLVAKHSGRTYIIDAYGCQAASYWANFDVVVSSWRWT
jgi:hypothetical protein